MPKELLQWDTKIVSSVFKNIQQEVISQGYMPNVDLFADTLQAAEDYNTAVDTIQNTHGYDIKVFNNSSARRKAEKKSPRIVIYQSRTFAGEIGAPIHAIISNDKTVGGKYKSGFMPQKASSVVIAIHLISGVSKQFSILNSILANVIGQRQYLPIYYEETNTYDPIRRFLCEQTSFNDSDDSLEGVFEKIYYYTVPDIYLSSMSNIREVAPIKEIFVELAGGIKERPFVKVGVGPVPNNTSFPYVLPFTLA